MPIPVICRCGAINSLYGDLLVDQFVDAAVRGVIYAVHVPELPVVCCRDCNLIGIDGTADDAIRWALVIAGVIDCDKTHSNALEHIRCAIG